MKPTAAETRDTVGELDLVGESVNIRLTTRGKSEDRSKSRSISPGRRSKGSRHSSRGERTLSSRMSRKRMAELDAMRSSPGDSCNSAKHRRCAAAGESPPLDKPSPK